MPQLAVIGGPGSGERVPVTGQMTLGRDETPFLRDDVEVSRKHALVWDTGQGLAIQDLGSSNGTWVNGMRIENAAWLRPGDRVQIGTTTLAVEEDAAPPAGPVAPQVQQQATVQPAAQQPAAGATAQAPGGSPLALNRLVVSQKAKLIELTNEYGVFDEQGQQVAVVRQEGQSVAKKALRMVANVDALMTHTVSMYDLSGARLLTLVKPRHFWKANVQVTDGAGTPAGSIAQQKVIGKIKFSLHDAAGQQVGMIQGENWRAWNFAILDPSGAEIGRITKQWRGAMAELFTTADRYMLEIHPSVQGPLRLVILAAGVGIDLVLKQAEGG